CARDYYGSDYW
nr:immunoglobulin heavy chain junction region [Mus musculus]MBK4189191.1 immunoglobulin heavy chain junction region [Mus musculus]